LAILRIARAGHPVLRMVAQPVERSQIATASFQRFCEDLVDTMLDYDGAGLAAPQVHSPIRVVVVTLDDANGPEIWVNPVVTPLGSDTRRSFEGCLSLPKLRAAVVRPKQVKVTALGQDGLEIEHLLKGFSATVAQHECDHLDGVLFIDRCDTKSLSFLGEYRRYGPLDEWDLEEGVRLEDDETELYSEDDE
jgi:peptide deformylase